MPRHPKRPKLGLDLDGCVFAFDLGACLTLQMRGNPIEVRESLSWNDIQRRVSYSEWEWLWTDGVRQVFENSPAYPEVVPVLHSIQEVVDIAVITHRPRVVADITLRKLAAIGLRPIEVHHVQAANKAHVSEGCFAFVDDKPQNVRDLAEAHHVPVFMPRKPWNQELHFPDQEGPLDIRPYDDMREVYRYALHAAEGGR